MRCRLCPHPESMHGPYGCSECPCSGDFEEGQAPPPLASVVTLRDIAHRLQQCSEDLLRIAAEQEKSRC